MKTLVLGLGNPILSDDAVGLHAARAAASVLQGRQDIESVKTITGACA